MKKQKLIVLTGPTGVGKSRLSLALAEKVGGEVISCDSMQVYRGMDIGTDKLTEEERGGIPHHLIDVLDPRESFDVYSFQGLAGRAMEDIWSRGKVPLLVGGTGFYIQALLYGIDFDERGEKGGVLRASDPDIKRCLEERIDRGEADLLYEELSRLDPESTQTIHRNNIKRVIRALEFYYATGKKISDHNQEQRQRTSPYDLSYFVLTDDRPILYEQIEKRVDRMVERGLIEEVRGLLEAGVRREMTSMQGIGYREVLSYLEGELSFPRAVELIKQNTRHFAKRQLTWFRREREVHWFNKKDYDRRDDFLLQELLDQSRSKES